MFNNRPLMFRAWDSKTNKLFKPIHLMCDSDDSPSIKVGLHRPSDYPLMQFTGLYDKNGKEMYENDIIYYASADNEIDLLGRIIFKDAEFCIEIKNDGYNNFLQLKNREKCIEVLGNIFENKDLLSSSTWQKPGETA